MGDYLVDRLRRFAQDTPDNEAVSCVEVSGADRSTATLTYGELDRRARAVASRLRARCGRGDRVLLLYPTGLDFVAALIGCMYARTVPVPAPVPGAHDRRGSRTAAIACDAEAAAALTDSRHLDEVREALGGSGPTKDLPCLATDTFGTDVPGAPLPETPCDADTVAFLQYTSGSTSDPKGVVVTHGALADNVRFIRHVMRLGDHVKCCSWLPLYHDMGLVGMLLAPLYLGGSTVLLSPSAFLRRPYLWLQLMSEHRVTNTAAPDFAYDLCARQVTPEKAAALDLSALHTAVNGAEPIRADTLARFNERLAPAGLRPDAVSPSYGMAESTLLITTTARDRVPTVTEVSEADLEQHRFVRAAEGRRGLPLVSSGRPGWMDVRIVDPDTGAGLPEGRVGEIWARGDSLSAGYWNNEAETARVFGAVTAEGEAGFLRTGDLGALVDGELYVTGRLKDMLIVHGRNLYPHDIEREVSAMHPAFEGLQGSVCSLPTGREDIVVMHELRLSRARETDPGRLARQVREELARSLGVGTPSVVLLRPGHVRRTTSGKVRRALMRELFMTGGLQPVHEELTPAVSARYRAGTGAAPGRGTGPGPDAGGAV